MSGFRTELAGPLAAVIVESAVDAIVVIDAQGRIELFNPAAERLFGYTNAEVIGRNVSILMPAPYRDEHDGYIRRYLEDGQPRIIGIGREVQGLKRDGTLFPLHLSVAEMVVDGQPKFTGILHDLSSRVALEQRLRSSEERWRAIVESAVDAIIVIDGRGTIEAFNPAAERLFGYAEQDAVGRNVSLLMPSPYREEHDGYLARYQREGGARVIGVGREVTARHRDGSVVPVHLSVGELVVGGERKFVGILHDLTPRKRMEQLLSEQQSLAKIGEMAAVLAHEIRNPLAGIRGAMQVMAARYEPASKEAMVTKEIIARVDTLSELMQDLLLYARPPKPRPAPVDLASLMVTIVDLIGRDPDVSGVQVTVEGAAPLVRADAELLKIVFQNLLINGAHAMAGRGRLHVQLHGDGDRCSVAFADSGPGIPADIRDKIFTPFFTTKIRGTGLGLPTAKRLVEAQGGTIAIDCPPSGGTTVIVQLPILSA
jgi:two-component system sensor kinase FixL